MALATVNGVEIFYERAGAGERVVLTHGAWTDARTWQALVSRLRRSEDPTWETVTWDRRGHSRSGDGGGGGSVQQDAWDLAALIEMLGGDPVHAVGNSAGGSVVLNLVIERPDLVKTAAVHEPGPLGLLESWTDGSVASDYAAAKELAGEVERMISKGEVGAALERFIADVLGPDAWDMLPSDLKDTMEANATTVGDDLRDGFDPTSVDVGALASSPVPLLVSTGSSSPLLERSAAIEIGRLAPNARLTVIPDAGHIPHRTHVEEYCALLVSLFVEGSGRRT